MIRRAERFDVELTGGVHDAGLRGGVDLQLRIVRGGGDRRAELSRAFDDRNGERRALGRVGAGAELVKQHQRAVAAGVQNPDDVRHVRRERGQALLDALLIADVRHDLVEHGQTAAVRGGDVQAALRHHGEQAHGLERDGLAAGVGAGDDERIVIFPQRNVDGHDRVLRDERMARASERHTPFGERRRGAVELVGKLCLGEDDVQPHEHIKVQRDVLAVGGAVGTELSQDALDLRLLLRAQLPELIVCLHCRHGLDEERRAGAGHVVHESGHGPLVLGLDGDDVALGARRDDGLLQGLGVARRGDDLLQRVVHSRARRADEPADGGKLGARRVRDLVLAHDGAGDLVLQKIIRLQGVEEIVDAGLLLALDGAVAAHGARRAEDAGDVDELARVQNAAHVGALQACAHVLHAGERGAPLHHHELGGGAGLVQAFLHLGAVAGGAERAGDVLRRGGRGLLREQLQHGGQLQRPQGSDGLFLHRSFTFFQ